MEAERAKEQVEAARRRREAAAAEDRAAIDDLIEAYREAREAGVSTTEIARLAGLTRDGLYKLLARRGVEPWHRRV